MRLCSVGMILLLASNAVAGPTIEVRLADKLEPKPATTGRIVLAFSPENETPRFTDVGPPGHPHFGIDVKDFTPAAVAVFDEKALGFPVGMTLTTLPAGTYQVQAVFMQSKDILLPSAPGNVTSKVQRYTHDPKATEPLKITLDTVAVERKPKEQAGVKFVHLPSKLLSDFHGRLMVVRFAVVLPKDFKEDAATTYPIIFHIGGFGGRYTGAARMPADARFVQVMLDGAGPFGDPYSVNSANNGPYGDSLVTEVIPYLEKNFRATGKRFTTGGSTGGWVSLALQVFYPDVFSGCWSQCPDGVDFRAFQLTNINHDKNMYSNRYGFERPAQRTLEGDTVYTVRHESRMERVLGVGGRWELSGQQWGSWNAVYGPKGHDGLPKPLWDNETGAIDKSVLKHWEKYDLRLILERDWATLGPKLAGKIHIWVGDADDYFLNNGVHYLKAMLDKQTTPKFDGVIEIAPRRRHESGWNRTRVLNEMAEKLK